MATNTTARALASLLLAVTLAACAASPPPAAAVVRPLVVPRVATGAAVCTAPMTPDDGDIAVRDATLILNDDATGTVMSAYPCVRISPTIQSPYLVGSITAALFDSGGRMLMAPGFAIPATAVQSQTHDAGTPPAAEPAPPPIFPGIGVGMSYFLDHSRIASRILFQVRLTPCDGPGTSCHSDRDITSAWLLEACVMDMQHPSVVNAACPDVAPGRHRRRFRGAVRPGLAE